MTSRGLELEELRSLPLFPLPGVVLFPHTYMPLHIFEPRYRALVSTVLRDGGAMGVVQLCPQEPGSAVPRVQPITGVGRIARHEELPDGRFLILLQGLGRARIEREIHTDEPFRRFELSSLEEEPLSEAQASHALLTLRECLRPVAVTLPEGGAPLLEAAAQAHDPGELADLLASTLIDCEAHRQSLLEMTDPGQRVREVARYLAEVLLHSRPPSAAPSALN